MFKQEKDILRLELHCLIKQETNDFSIYERAKEMWGI